MVSITMNPQMPDLLTKKQEEIERERRKKQAEKIKLTNRDSNGKFIPVSVNKLTQTVSERATQKIADIFNTNRSSAEGITGRRKQRIDR